MKPELTTDQKKIFLEYSKKEPSSNESPKIVEKRAHDKDYDFFHERDRTNLSRLISLSEKEFSILSNFLKQGIDILKLNREELRSLEFCHVEFMWQLLMIDLPYFPEKGLRRNLLLKLETILGCTFNFVLCYTAAQKKILQQ